MFRNGSPVGQAERRKWFRQQALRWHPDKATRVFGGLEDEKVVMGKVLMISQVINGLMEVGK